MANITHIKANKESGRSLKQVNARPQPPDALGVEQPFLPAAELREWVFKTFIEDTGGLHNPDHSHLQQADLEFLWAAASFTKQMRMVVGQAEEVMIRAGGWAKRRQEAQFEAWFGRVPGFVITIGADYAAEVDDTAFCALIEHELYHIAHKANSETGELMFDRDGNPKLGMRGHDVEEFVGVVKRYGVPKTGALRELIDAGVKGKPEIAALHISQACGTCMLKSA